MEVDTRWGRLPHWQSVLDACLLLHLVHRVPAVLESGKGLWCNNMFPKGLRVQHRFSPRQGDMCRDPDLLGAEGHCLGYEW